MPVDLRPLFDKLPDQIANDVVCFAYLCARAYQSNWTEDDTHITAQVAKKMDSAGRRFNLNNKHRVVALQLLMVDVIKEVRLDEIH